MTEHLIAQINKYVQQDDVLYFLGDWTFGGIDKIWKFRQRLNVRTIHLIYGNHDTAIKKNRELLILEHEIAFLPPGETAEHFKGWPVDIRIPAQELFTTCQDRLETTIDGQMFVLDHYSMQVWNGSHKGVMMVFGHSHSSLQGIGRSMDVGVDNAFKLFGEYRPFSVAEVIEILSKIPVHEVDHHSSSTNFSGLN